MQSGRRGVGHDASLGANGTANDSMASVALSVANLWKDDGESATEIASKLNELEGCRSQVETHEEAISHFEGQETTGLDVRVSTPSACSIL